MFSGDFVLSVLSEDGKICKEELFDCGDFKKGPTRVQGVSVPFGSNYQIRLRNKNSRPCACDVYLDGELVNSVGQIMIFGNDYLDLKGFLKKDGKGKEFQFVKAEGARQPGESQNGVIEVRFYLQKEIDPRKVEKFEKLQEDLDYLKKHMPQSPIIERPIWIIPMPYNPWPTPWIPYYPYYPQATWSITTNNVDDNKQWAVYNKSDTNNIYKVDSYSTTSDDGRSSVSGFKVTCNAAQAGATVEGKDFNHEVKGGVEFQTEAQATILTLKLIGIEDARLRCKKCNMVIEKNWFHCPTCGEVVGYNKKPKDRMFHRKPGVRI